MHKIIVTCSLSSMYSSAMYEFSCHRFRFHRRVKPLPKSLMATAGHNCYMCNTQCSWMEKSPWWLSYDVEANLALDYAKWYLYRFVHVCRDLEPGANVHGTCVALFQFWLYIDNLDYIDVLKTNSINNNYRSSNRVCRDSCHCFCAFLKYFWWYRGRFCSIVWSTCFSWVLKNRWTYSEKSQRHTPIRISHRHNWHRLIPMLHRRSDLWTRWRLSNRIISLLYELSSCDLVGSSSWHNRPRFGQLPTKGHFSFNGFSFHQFGTHNWELDRILFRFSGTTNNLDLNWRAYDCSWEYNGDNYWICAGQTKGGRHWTIARRIVIEWN